MAVPTGRHLNKSWKVNVLHALYRENGSWYHCLERFPGALFDAHGYVVFETEQAYRDCSYLQIGKEIGVSGTRGIAAIPGYVFVE